MLSFKRYQIIINEKQLINWIYKLKKAMVFAFKAEIDCINNFNWNIHSNIIGLSFAIEPGLAAYVPVAHNCSNLPKHQLARDRVLELLKPILEDEKTFKIGKNLKYDRNILQNYGIELCGIAFDIMLESYILSGITGHYNRNSLSKHFLKQKTKFITTNTSIPKTHNKIKQISLEKISYYATEDIDVTLQLHIKIWPKLQKQEGLLNIFQNIEIPLISVLSRIERNGVKIDAAVLHKHSEEITLRMHELEQKAQNIVGESFNLSSNKQLQNFLFEKQGIKPLKKTPSGALSTSEEVLEALALEYSLPKLILEYRRLRRLKSTYTDKLPMMINPKTGRVHTSYHQAVTTTGRLSSSNPNMQNIPIRNKEGRRIRKAFIAPEDYLLVSADYSQIELRIMAHLSGDKELIAAFAESKDIHRATAAEIFGLPLDRVTEEQRQSAKTINFGLIYGMSAFSLSRKLHIPCKDSQKYIDLYFERYPGVLEYMEQTLAKAKKRGYVETLDGRRLYMPNIKCSNLVRRAGAERAAINAPMQGTAADIIKRAMIAIDNWLKKEQPRVKMIIQVHDELVFEVHKEEVETVEKKIHDIMENSINLNVPMLVKVVRGENWDQAH